MSHEVETMMYVGETPWHGLGVKLINAPTIADAIKQAGLAWNVELVQLQLPDGRKVDRFATVRSTDGRILGSSVGPDFRPLQNVAALDFFDPFVASGAATLETAGSLRGGARVWILAKIDRADSVIVPGADDRVAKYLLLAHGHDGSLSIRVSLTPIRVVCQNTLSAAIARGANTAVRIRHTAGAANALQAVQDTINQADQDFEKAADVFRALAGKCVTERQIRAYVDTVFPPPKAKVIAAPSAAVQAAMDEWNDGPTDADIGTDAADAPALFSSLLARPVASTFAPTEIEAASRAAERAVERRIGDNIIEIFEKGGRRGDLNLEGVKGTAWAAYNAVTEYLTWDRGRNADNRMSSLWFQDSGVSARALQNAAKSFL